MGLINSVLTWIFKKRIDQIQHFIDHPIETQESLLMGLIQKSANTEIGKLYGYESIHSIGDYKNRVPIKEYDGFKPYIERVMQGGQNLIWPSEIKWFAKSSGTTSDKSKFLPVSKEALDDCHFKGGRDLLAMYCYNNPDTNIFSGKGLVMGGSTQVNKMQQGSFYGDVSAVMMSNMPLLAQLIKTPDLSIAMMEDYEKKILLMAEETMKKNVTHIVGVPTWTVVLIKKIFELSGKDNLRDIWPNLETYFHGGVSFTPYREQFKNLIRGEGMHYMETYNASEGFFAIQHTLDNSDLLLMLDYGVFFEFMPMEQYGHENPQTKQLDEVEINKNYAVVISTNAGLWRYLIGDTIQFTSLDPYCIKISGRTKHFINAFGEELIVDNSDRAMNLTCHECGAILSDYTAGPIYLSDNDKGGHEWIIEFEKEPKDLQMFTLLLDNHLKQLNSDYEAKRTGDIALGLPVVHMAPRGLFYKWLESKGKLGGQNKVPRLANDRKYLEQILPFLK